MAKSFKKPGFFSRRAMFGTTIGGALMLFLAGIIFWGGFNTVMEATNTLTFCISCHEMEENVYQEYTPTIHYSNRTGVRATCSDCHVPHDWIHKMKRKIQASKEVYHKILGTVNTPEKFDEHRLTMAKRVWNTMKKTDSRECRNCHNFESMNPKYQKPRARKQHLNAFETGQTCIDCHKGISHTDVRDQLTDEEIEVLEAPNPAFIREVPAMYSAGMKEAAETEKAEKEKQKKKKAKAKAKIQKKIDRAVEKAIKKAKAEFAASGTTAAVVQTETTNSTKPSGASKGTSIDWSDVPSREILLMYPGQSSMEWMLNGKDHGGARPFIKAGDRCVDCHDNEIPDMGKKMVTGEKIEPTPIPGKRGHISVKVQAAHNADNIYMRFEWVDAEHTPVPFVDGGKMDPDNQIKLAVMFATDDVEYAAQSGCWGTCHHDLRTMPDAPDDKVTKYISESRTEIEIKGRNGKKRGGWDKRKLDADLKTEMEQNHFMDLLRYSSGTGKSEDGHVLADRIMEGGQGVVFNGNKEGDTWVVEMSRKLSSGQPGDISMALDKIYNFGFAIHDDYTSTRFHHVSLGYKLGFDNPDIEINAVKK